MRPAAIEDDLALARESMPPAGGTRGPVFLLTPREIEVLRLVGLGYSNAQIAEELFISPQTTRCHLKAIHDKTGIAGRPRLVIIAAKLAA